MADDEIRDMDAQEEVPGDDEATVLPIEPLLGADEEEEDEDEDEDDLDDDEEAAEEEVV